MTQVKSELDKGYVILLKMLRGSCVCMIRYISLDRAHLADKERARGWVGQMYNDKITSIIVHLHLLPVVMFSDKKFENEAT